MDQPIRSRTGNRTDLPLAAAYLRSTLGRLSTVSLSADEEDGWVVSQTVVESHGSGAGLALERLGSPSGAA
jgi:hypothetical protein